MRKLHPNSHESAPNLWDKVKQHKNGKLIGMLTDKLALASLPVQGQATQSNRMTVSEAKLAHKTHIKKEGS